MLCVGYSLVPVPHLSSRANQVGLKEVGAGRPVTLRQPGLGFPAAVRALLQPLCLPLLLTPSLTLPFLPLPPLLLVPTSPLPPPSDILDVMTWAKGNKGKAGLSVSAGQAGREVTKGRDGPSRRESARVTSSCFSRSQTISRLSSLPSSLLPVCH